MREDIVNFSRPYNKPPFYMEMAGISYCDKNYTCYRSKSNVTVLEYIVKGSGYLSVNGKEYTASEGDVYLLRQGSRHNYRSDAEDPWIKIFFNIQGSLAERILDEYHWEEPVIKNVYKEQEFREMFAFVSDSSHTQTEIFNYMAVAFFKMVIELDECQKKNKIYDIGDEQQISEEMMQLVEYISNNPDRVVSNDELAALIYRSKDYCIKKFTETFGRTPHQYQIMKKMYIAKSMLRNSKLSIADIATSVGYNDPNNFSTAFKKYCGISPYKYRKKGMEEYISEEQNERI